MIRKNCKKTEDFFDNFAAGYDEAFVQHRNMTLAEAAKIFKRNNYTDGSILDVGCGTGLLSEVLNGNFNYTGMDISSQMLKKAGEKKYFTIKQSAEDGLPDLMGQSYDFVVSCGVLYYIKDFNAVLHHMIRIAKRAVIFDLCDLPEEFIRRSSRSLYNHSQTPLPKAREDYLTFGWISPTQGVSINTRMILL